MGTVKRIEVCGVSFNFIKWTYFFAFQISAHNSRYLKGTEFFSMELNKFGDNRPDQLKRKLIREVNPSSL